MLAMPTRAHRRAISRDLARQFPVPRRLPSHGVVGRIVHARRPKTVRLRSPRSGQDRINAKRDARAGFWLGRTTLYDLARQLGIPASDIDDVPAHIRAILAATPAI